MFRFTFFLGVCLFAPWWLSAPAAAQTPGGQLSFADCKAADQNGVRRISGECANFTAAENPAEPDGKQIPIHIMKVPARNRNPAPDPVFFIAGGPGQASSEGFLAMAQAFYFVRKDRDIFLVDQRGTGKSNRMQCPLDETSVNDALEWNQELHRAWLAKCLESLSGDPRFYTTSVAVHDLDAVRAALGYEQINIYGISYGTRVALAYLRAYPERVRSVVIDGVVPADLALGPDISLDAQRAVEMMITRCAQDASCNDAFPKLAQSFTDLVARLQDKPVNVALRDPTTAEPVEISFSGRVLSGSVRLLSYQTESISLLPLLIHQAYAENDFAPLAAQAVLVGRGMNDVLAYGMHNAVVCTEDVPFYENQADVQQRIESTYLGTLQFDVLVDMCKTWPRGIISDDFKQPVESDKPVLLLSGEVDPVTPPANAEHAARSLTNSLHLVAPGQGHGIAPRGCTPRILAQFINTASIADLETECISELAPAPFFVRFTGPTP
ncbi:MAG: alpha/beta hydrolase [Gammaproteobacteria bacterium]|nr:alpha/beta hydrolase [Gammaproteobacteria bacterium]